jgi:hypothetical protein
MSDELATFDDRLTMRHTRVFPHPIELVWEAVSEGRHLETWLLPVSPSRSAQRSVHVGITRRNRGSVGQHDRRVDPPTRSGSGRTTATCSSRRTGRGRHAVALHSEPRRVPGSSTRSIGSISPQAPTPWRPGFCAASTASSAPGEFLDSKITYEQQRPFIEAVHTGEFTGDFRRT